MSTKEVASIVVVCFEEWIGRREKLGKAPSFQRESRDANLEKQVCQSTSYNGLLHEIGK